MKEKPHRAKRTLVLFETGQREPYARTLVGLRKVLERAGVVFIEENGGGPGVRLRKTMPRRAGAKR